MPQSFEDFMAERERSSTAYSSGDPEPLDEIVATKGAATFFPPSGGTACGAEIVRERYRRDASAFSPGAKNRFEIMDSGASGDLAFWTGLQHFEGRLGGKEMRMKLRVTELFRREDGAWKLVHRHADPAADPPAPRN